MTTFAPIVTLLLLLLAGSMSSSSLNLPGLIDPFDPNYWSSSTGVIFSGQSLSGLGGGVTSGDFNKDGILDIAISAPKASPNGRNQPGEVYIIFGTSSLPPTFNVTLMTASQGVTIQGADPSLGNLGVVKACGDINGDGIDDLLISTVTSGTVLGRVYVIFGSTTLPASIDLLTLSPSRGIVIIGIQLNDRFGDTITGIGDINGDSFDDILIGANQLNSLNGAAYLIYGNNTLPATIDLATAPSGVVTFTDSTGLEVGLSVARAGDMNADGIPDFFLGEANNKLYLIYGQRSFGSSSVDIASLPVSSRVCFLLTTGGLFGSGVSLAGDVNQDGIQDFLVSSPISQDLSRLLSGTVYLIYGRTSFPSTVTFPADLTPAVGTSFVGRSIFNYLGFGASAIAGGSDVNKDGIPDFILGAPIFPSYAYVIYGNTNFTSTTYDLATFSSAEGSLFTHVNATSLEYIGLAVSFVGDINQDGAIDFVIGSTGAVNTDGRAYLVYGIPEPSTSTSLTPSYSQTPSQTPSRSPSQTSSQTASETPSQTPSHSLSQSLTQTLSITPSETPSKKTSQTPSQTPSQTQTPPSIVASHSTTHVVNPTLKPTKKTAHKSKLHQKKRKSKELRPKLSVKSDGTRVRATIINWLLWWIVE